MAYFFDKLPKRARRDARLSARDFRVLLAVSSIPEDGVTSARRIAERAATDERHARRTLARLVELGYLAREAQARPTGAALANKYTVIWADPKGEGQDGPRADVAPGPELPGGGGPELPEAPGPELPPYGEGRNCPPLIEEPEGIEPQQQNARERARSGGGENCQSDHHASGDPDLGDLDEEEDLWPRRRVATGRRPVLPEPSTFEDPEPE